MATLLMFVHVAPRGVSIAARCASVQTNLFMGLLYVLSKSALLGIAFAAICALIFAVSSAELADSKMLFVVLLV